MQDCLAVNLLEARGLELQGMGGPCSSQRRAACPASLRAQSRDRTSTWASTLLACALPSALPGPGPEDPPPAELPGLHAAPCPVAGPSAWTLPIKAQSAVS